MIRNSQISPLQKIVFYEPHNMIIKYFEYLKLYKHDLIMVNLF